MKKCSSCNIQMVEGTLYGKPRFMDMDHDIDKFYFNIDAGEQSSFLGIKVNVPKQVTINACVCPNCGKIELFIDPEKLK